ncbi:trehalose-phosphatase [Streptomyces clavuligerus]|uniref:Trehalose 6-phosphate phosphatase n=1 Tax=Streptomyces clavuligerus TaxID=1901 RepID=B5GNY8_STRCL|nr:trehalose-phosphatase [Streptomyces clavuligerus]ANW18964.1 trehalose-phosphatase [Streptomyces clavuligerus]AXU13542.1 trehalose-phosphatase [Streptomyces clavuligerus]EDY48034.1 trehalose-6-phosphatase [Streptomyces clavuligerus]EFG08324.1 Putative trehalose-6-phosphatase [Streptomyces clavuligerus]MBY6303503.1 trehalose-phosphatase [Streptomyces clavuligerus]
MGIPPYAHPLPEPSTPAGRDGLAALLERPARALVALDFDGTLAEIVPDPEQARAHPATVPALARLAPKVASVAVITGRPAGVAVRYGGFAGVPGLEHLVVLGHYGAERWDAVTGTVTAPAPHPGVAAVRAELPGFLDTIGAWNGTWIEEKGRAVAVHTRRAGDPRAAFEALREPLAVLASRHGLVLEPGRMVLELRPPGMDKGVALAEYAREAGADAVLYAGDDLGDLPAYAAVEKLRSDGVPGLLVCSGSTEVTELADRSDLLLPGPAAVVGFLSALAERL